MKYGNDVSRFCKLCLDLTHGAHRLTRSVPKRVSADHGPFSSAIKEAMTRCKLPPSAIFRGNMDFSQWCETKKGAFGCCSGLSDEEFLYELGKQLLRISVNLKVESQWRGLLTSLFIELGQANMALVCDLAWRQEDDGKDYAAPRCALREMVHHLGLDRDEYVKKKQTLKWS